jgi:Global regulator protein family
VKLLLGLPRAESLGFCHSGAFSQFKTSRKKIMLVLHRKSGESLIVGETTIKFQIIGGRVKCIIDAPEHVRIVRSELINPPPPLAKKLQLTKENS